MKIGIFGGLGYIGSNLVTELAEDHQIAIGDNVSYDMNRDWFDGIHTNENIDFIFLDIRNDKDVKRFIDNCDKIVNLSALVGETICKKDTALTNIINNECACRISDYCKEQNKPMIFLSTCSNYGISTELCNEDSQLNPLTQYSKTKVLAEMHILETNENATVLRMSTVFGISKSRTRMDIIPNQFVKEAIKTNNISIFQKDAIRPIIHIKDVTNVIKIFLEHTEKPQHQVYNVGFHDMNITKDEMAKQVARLTGATISEITSDDLRTYKVDFSRLHNEFMVTKKETLVSGLTDLLVQIDNKKLPLDCGNY